MSDRPMSARYDYYRSDDERDREVYLDNRTGVGAQRGRGYRATLGAERGGYGRAYGEDDKRQRDRERGYSSYGNSESRSFRPDDYGADDGQGSYSNESYSARDYQTGDSRQRQESRGSSGYGGQGGSRWNSERDFDQTYFAGGAGYGHGFGREDERGQQRSRHEGGRGFWDRASDTVASWLGDDEARRRHEADSHRGKGPKGYKRSDDRIREDVNERLTDDLWLDATHIEVAVQDSEITLTGTVNSRNDRRYAERIAESVSGSTHVQNNLRVSGTSQGGTTGAQTGAQTGAPTGATGNQDDVLARQAAGKH